MGFRTPLYTAHERLNAKVVPFGGWDMPLHYGSQLEEHHAVRRDAGMFDVSHMQPLDVTGTDAKAFLQYLLANDVAKLKTPGKALYSCMLNERGGVVDDLICYYLGPDRYRPVVNAATADKDIAWMKQHAASGQEQTDEGLQIRGIAARFQRLAADEGALGRLPGNGPAESALQWAGVLVHILPVQIHAGLETQRVTSAKAAGPDSGIDQFLPQGPDSCDRQHDLEAVFACVAGAAH